MDFKALATKASSYGELQAGRECFEAVHRVKGHLRNSGSCDGQLGVNIHYANPKGPKHPNVGYLGLLY